MSKKLVLFLLAFGFTAGFASAASPGSGSCVGGCQTTYLQCNQSHLYTGAQCYSAYQSCLDVCAANAGTKPISGGTITLPNPGNGGQN